MPRSASKIHQHRRVRAPKEYPENLLERKSRSHWKYSACLNGASTAGGRQRRVATAGRATARHPTIIRLSARPQMTLFMEKSIEFFDSIVDEAKFFPKVALLDQVRS